MGGKGVHLPKTLFDAERFLTKVMKGGGKILIEDRLYGPERSVIALTDGEEVYHFRSHKTTNGRAIVILGEIPAVWGRTPSSWSALKLME